MDYGNKIVIILITIVTIAITCNLFTQKKDNEM